MKALVVYESMYGNTRHIAEAIAEGLRWSMPADVVLARDAIGLDLEGVELVVVGGPTHAWGISSKRTRDGAAKVTKHPDHLLDMSHWEIGIRDWLDQADGMHKCRGVSFDTRFDKPKLVTGSAARSIQRRLNHAGFRAIDKPNSFRVTGMAGPLVPGEGSRAEQWGEAIGRSIVPFTERRLTPSRTAR